MRHGRSGKMIDQSWFGPTNSHSGESSHTPYCAAAHSIDIPHRRDMSGNAVWEPVGAISREDGGIPLTVLNC